MLGAQPISPTFPYTTLFRSCFIVRAANDQAAVGPMNIIQSRPPGRQLQRGWVMIRFARDTTTTLNPNLWKRLAGDRKSTRLNSSHLVISYAVFCLKNKTI